jgi:uncharacterized protein YggE
VRAEAVRDAQDRAAVYADALGLSGVTVAALYEPGLRPHEQPGWEGRGPFKVVQMGAADNAGGPTVSLRPERIEVSATISADFTAS